MLDLVLLDGKYVLKCVDRYHAPYICYSKCYNIARLFLTSLASRIQIEPTRADYRHPPKKTAASYMWPN